MGSKSLNGAGLVIQNPSRVRESAIVVQNRRFAASYLAEKRSPTIKLTKGYEQSADFPSCIPARQDIARFIAYRRTAPRRVAHPRC